MDEHLREYRDLLIAVEQKAQEDYDKTILSLSGGALGVSFAFVKDIVGSQPISQSWTLLASWIAWGTSVACVLGSFYASQRALRRAIKQVDEDKIYNQSPGGFYSSLTASLNALGGILFLVGVVFIVIFVAHNLR